MLNCKIDSSGGTDACWPWTGKLDPKGYGSCWHKGQTRRAHVVAFEEESGPVPEGMGVLHSCDNPPCCNPTHLFAGTNADNVADKVAKGRQAKGEAVASAKLTEVIVVLCRNRHTPYSKVDGVKAMAEEFGVSIRAMSKACRGETWKHVATPNACN